MIGGWRAGFRSPKTILGFFAALVAILGLTVYGLTKSLGAIPQCQWMVPYVLLFGAGAFTFVALAILFTAWFAPEKLMLGEITGSAYATIMKLKLGDSQRGDVTVVVPAAGGRRKRRAALTSGEITVEEDNE